MYYNFDQSLPVLLDRCGILTSFLVDPEIFKDVESYNNRHGTNILELAPKISYRKGHPEKTCKIVFGSFEGIVVSAREVLKNRWEATFITVNPRKILFRHNGRTPSVEEVLSAFTILREQVLKILRRPKDLIHVLPGLSQDSRASWNFLELALDLKDPEGKLQKALSSAHFPRMGEGARYRNGNFQIGSRNGPLKITFYRKDQEMKSLLRKHAVEDSPRVLRVEVTLRGEKLMHYLCGNGNTETIDDHLRLVRFTARQLIECHLAIVSRLQGCFQVPTEGSGKKDRMGRFIALVATNYDIPLADLLELNESGNSCSKRTTDRCRSAAREALEEISAFEMEEIFSENAYLYQPSIEIPALENWVAGRRSSNSLDPEVERVYGEGRGLM